MDYAALLPFIHPREELDSMTEKIDYRRFMNGYRDPITKAEEAERIRQEEEELRFRGLNFTGDTGGSSGERECGYREEGGTYAEVPSSRRGKPLEFFLTCVPVPIDRDEYRLHPKGLGVTLVDLPEACLTCNGSGETISVMSPEAIAEYPDIARTTTIHPCSVCGGVGLVPVTHIFDEVGTDNYPNVADFIEESRRRGVSRRLELEASEYARLTSRSRLIMLHKRACIFNPDEYYKEMQGLELDRLARAGCPKLHPQHKIEGVGGVSYITPKQAPKPEGVPLDPGCAALWWNDLEKGKPTGERAPELAACARCAGGGSLLDVQGYELQTGDPGGAARDGHAVKTCPDCEGRGKIEVDNPPGRFVERELKSGSYRGYARPNGVIPQYGLGIFAVFPLVKITVIDPEGKYQDRVERASRAGVQVDIEEY
jgi:hypothetical protein